MLRYKVISFSRYFTVASLALLFVFFVRVSETQAAINPPIAPTSTSNVFENSITYNWSWGGGEETRYIVERSTNGTNYNVVSTTIPSTTLSYTFSGLTPNTRYWFRVAAATSTSPTSTYATSSPLYTKAAFVDSLTPGLNSPTTSSIRVPILNTNNNPSYTRYFIYEFTMGTYFDASGAPTSSAVYLTTSTWGANFTATGLSVNTGHYFTAGPINEDGLVTPYNTDNFSVKYFTLANPAAAPTLGTPTDSSIPITINTAGNPATTTYAIQLFANNYGSSSFLSASGAVTGTPVYQNISTWGSNFSATGLVVDYDYQFAVIARNGNGINAATSSLSSVARTVASSGSSPSGIAIPVNTASQGGVPVNPSPAVSPDPIAVPGVPSEPIIPVTPKVVFKSLLSIGAKGVEVVALQQKLRELGLFKFSTNTGYFGTVTKAAVVAFQKKYNLKPYPGVVGPLTRTALNSL